MSLGLDCLFYLLACTLSQKIHNISEIALRLYVFPISQDFLNNFSKKWKIPNYPKISLDILCIRIWLRLQKSVGFIVYPMPSYYIPLFLDEKVCAQLKEISFFHQTTIAMSYISKKKKKKEMKLCSNCRKIRLFLVFFSSLGSYTIGPKILKSH